MNFDKLDKFEISVLSRWREIESKCKSRNYPVGVVISSTLVLSMIPYKRKTHDDNDFSLHHPLLENTLLNKKILLLAALEKQRVTFSINEHSKYSHKYLPNVDFSVRR